MSNHQHSTGKKPKSKAGAAPTRKRSKRSSSKPGPGRPTAARVEAINRAVLDEAHNQFWELGYTNTQMEAIADAVGISKRTLYDRYPNKFALVTAVVAEGTVFWTKIWTKDAAPDVNDSSTDLRKRLKQRARRAMEYCCSGEYERSERFWRSCPPIEDLWRMRYDLGHKRMAQIIANDITDLSADQTIKLPAALQLAEMLMAMLYGWWEAHHGVRRVTREEAQAYADHAVDVLFEGRSAWGGA